MHCEFENHLGAAVQPDSGHLYLSFAVWFRRRNSVRSNLSLVVGNGNAVSQPEFCEVCLEVIKVFVG